MTIVSGSQIKKIESDIFKKSGYRVDIAMSLAGKALADTAISSDGQKRKIAVICGHGNNGGDGFAATYFLNSAGHDVTALFNEDHIGKLSCEASYFHSLCVKEGLVSALESDLHGYDIIIDCLLGSGIEGIPKAETLSIITRINNSGAYIISADIPSGLPADGPVIHQHIINADKTVAMQYPKINTLIFPGKKYSGEVITAHIGFPSSCLTGLIPLAGLIDTSSFQSLLSVIKNETVHKYNKGHLLIIGGFNGMEGAALLSAMSALSSGAGLVTIATQKLSRTVIAGKYPEVMTSELPDSEEDLKAYISKIIEVKKINGVLIGPGMGRSPYASAVFDACFKVYVDGLIEHLLIDGDALHLFAMKNATNPRALSNIILTPHTGEAGNLLGLPSDQIATDLFWNSYNLSQKTHANIVLKGSSTVVCGDSEIGIWPGGIRSLATAGSGDVLSGIISAFMMQKGVSAFNAASAGVLVHGRCGLACNETATASGIIERIPDVISYLLNA